jgi:zinc protease
VIRKAALAAAFLVAVPALAAADPLRGTAPSGMAYDIESDPAQTSAAVALWYRAPSSGFDATPVTGLSRLSALTIAASSPITGTPLSLLVRSYGGRLSIASYPDSVSITAVVTPNHVDDVVRAMTADFFAPVIDAQGFAVAQRDDAENGLYRSFDPSEAIEDSLGGALFSAGPYRDPTIAMPNTVAGVTLAQVRAFAERGFRPGNALLVLTGNVSGDALAVAATRDGATPTPEAITAQPVARTPGSLERDGNATGIGLAWAGPPISDESAATAMDFVADALFAPTTGPIDVALSSLHAYATGKFVTYHSPGVFLVTITGDDAAAARPIVLRTIAAFAAPMSRSAFAQAREAFEYRLLADLDTPPELADTTGWYTIEGNAGYAPSSGDYFHVADALSPQSVARTVQRYLTVTPAVVTLVRPHAPVPVKKS